MSLLHNEDFAIYQLRTAYLANIHDGIGERLININTAFLNDPAFRAAGWNSDPAEIKRTYSPPIPAAVTSEYFRTRPQSAGANGSFDEEEEEGGLVTGAGNDTVGPSLGGRRRRRKEPMDEDDSSDLSDESDEEVENTQRPANKIRFEKMPGRTRAGSSPVPSKTDKEGPSVLITSPSRPPEHPRLRRGSLGAVEAIKARSRRGTTTSSEMSSENELDPSVFRRQQITNNASRPRAGTLSEQIKEDKEDQEEEEEEEKLERLAQDEADAEILESQDAAEGGILGEATISNRIREEEEVEEGEDVGDPDDVSDSDGSSLASDFSEEVGDNSLLRGVTSPLEASSLGPINLARSATPSPKKPKPPPPALPELPPARPISSVPPVSALAQAIKARNTKPVSPVERFATLSGKGDPNPLYLKIYLPGASSGSGPMQVLLRRSTNAGTSVTVGEAIGFSLWQYGEENCKPPITGDKLNVNWWTLRIVEDEEVDYDFPPLVRTRPMTDFTSNNNRPARGRSRERPVDEFALVEAEAEQYRENEEATPVFSQQAAEAKAQAEQANSDEPEPPQPEPQNTAPPVTTGQQNPIRDPRLITGPFRRDTGNTAMDSPALPTTHAVPRTGAPKALNIHFTDGNYNQHVETVQTTTDTYLAEVFDQICKRLNIDKALYVLKVTNTSTIAPSDRTVEALAGRSSLDLVRRRFVGDGAFGLSGSPGSTSPNAPLLLTTQGTPKRSRRAHPLAQQADLVGGGLTGTGLGLGLVPGGAAQTYKRYNVIRKQPMSFTSSQPRVLVLDGEYMHIMPAETGAGVGTGGKEGTAQGKTTSVHFSNIIGCKVNRKHPKTLRIVVFREKESKRYDLEAVSQAQAAEIVSNIRRGMEDVTGLAFE